jgi:hypothetical protein
MDELTKFLDAWKENGYASRDEALTAWQEGEKD